jgi:hypothetical protein
MAQQYRINRDEDNYDDDLSGCLASGFLGKQSNQADWIASRQSYMDNNSGDLSGCLSGTLKPRQIAPKTTAKTKTPVEIELDDSPASDWFYTH